jgi:GTP-binding protein
VLIDARHGIKPNDADVLDLLDTAAVSYQIILTKVDKLKAGQLAKLEDATLAKLAKRAAAFPEIITTSSEKNLGMAELRQTIAGLVLK